MMTGDTPISENLHMGKNIETRPPKFVGLDRIQFVESIFQVLGHPHGFCTDFV